MRDVRRATRVEAGEVISSLSIDDCIELGQRVPTEVVREDVRLDPAAQMIMRQGAQAVHLVVQDGMAVVDKRRTEDTAATERRLAQEGILRQRMHDLRQREEVIEDFRGVTREHQGRFPLLEDIPVTWLVVVLGFLAFGEYVLNRVAFVTTGESSTNVDIMAIALGIGLVAAAHLGGVAVRRLVDRFDGVRLTRVHLVLASIVGSLLLASIAVAGLRSAYFSHEDEDVPTLMLFLLQFFLLWVALGVSMGHYNPNRKELSRLERERQDAQEDLQASCATWATSRSAELAAREALCRDVAVLVQNVRVQQEHTERQIAAFAMGVQETSKRQIDLDPSGETVEPPRITRLAAWVDEQVVPPVATDLAETLATFLTSPTVADPLAAADTTTGEGRPAGPDVPLADRRAANVHAAVQSVPRPPLNGSPRVPDTVEPDYDLPPTP